MLLHGLFHRWIADNANPRSLSSRLRRRRFKVLRAMADAFRPPVQILDLGGTESYWRLLPREARRGLDVTLLNLSSEGDSSSGFRSVTGDARNLGQFDDGSFDIVFSNSVIEHVGGFEDQQRMASEVRRVGRAYYVQTPNRHFPIEPHYQFPFFQYLPEQVQVALLRRFDLGWYQRVPDLEEAVAHVRSVRLLTKRELQSLFPDGHVRTEWFLGLPKSFIAISRISLG